MSEAVRALTTAAAFGPWPDRATAWAFWRGVLSAAERPTELASLTNLSTWPALAAWLVQEGLGPLIYSAYQTVAPDVALAFKADYQRAIGEQAMYQVSLVRMLEGMDSAEIPVVLLKGAALAYSAYPHPALRTMSDVDVWLHPQQIRQAMAHIQQIGFRHYDKDGRETPPRLSPSGKVKFNLPNWTNGGIELHSNPFAGVWLESLAAIDWAAVWQRRQPLMAAGAPAWQLSPEDTLLQVGLHLIIGNQLGQAVLRGLIDITLAARTRPVDCVLLARRAHTWGVSSAVWLSLDLAQHIFGLPEVETALRILCPAAPRRAWLRRLADPERLAQGQVLRGRSRRLLLLALVDRPIALLRLLPQLRRRSVSED